MSAVDYTVDGKTFEGFFLRPKGKDVAPVVIIAHAWGGLGDNEREKAARVAEMGYAAFAIDVYGKGKRGTTVEENQALMNPLVEDRAELQKRLAGGLAAARQQVGVDPKKAAAIGFCFGGLCVLDMARANQDVLGVASFHGLFRPAEKQVDLAGGQRAGRQRIEPEGQLARDEEQVPRLHEGYVGGHRLGRRGKAQAQLGQPRFDLARHVLGLPCCGCGP